MRAPRHAPGGSLLRGPTMQGSNPRSAGPTCCTALRTGNWGNNPRERGADEVAELAHPPALEQPPRARGRRGARDRRHRTQGATPASAGPTTSRTLSPSRTRSNPRERGADSTGRAPVFSMAEQLPRARGRRRGQAHPAPAAGATSASAGPTCFDQIVSPRTSSNPRERGADDAESTTLPCMPEQPPRARGRRATRWTGGRQPGATPASAGPTIVSWADRSGAGSNPRERGADALAKLAPNAREEQPPRARGRYRQG